MKTNIIIRLIILAFAISAVTACGGGGGGGSSSGTIDESTITVGSVGTLSYEPASCSELDQMEFINTLMHDVYLWSDYTPDVDYSSYSSQDDLLDALRYSTYDNWSYIITIEDYNSYYAGDNVGLGIRYTYDDSTNEIFITHAYPDSPAADAGLARGYSLTKINGYTAANIINNSRWDDAFGPSTAGYDVVIEYIDTSNNSGTVTVTKDEYTADSVAAYSILTNGTNGKNIGYLSYLTFNGNYSSDLSEAFTAFKNNSVEELVIDLRYNGGGLVSGARYLASQIGGLRLYASIMLAYLHNTDYSSWDRALYFTLSSYGLSIDKVVFLTTSGTASSSELVISSLTPYMDVTLIGSTTHGKPVGMYSFEYCDSYIVPISFQTVNANAEGGYFNGLGVTCSADDDVAHPLGDPSEEMLAEAVSYLENGTCTSGKSNGHERLKPEKRKGIHYIFNER